MPLSLFLAQALLIFKKSHQAEEEIIHESFRCDREEGFTRDSEEVCL